MNNNNIEEILNMLAETNAEMIARNGLDHCKNCGIHHGDLANELDNLIKEEREDAVRGCYAPSTPTILRRWLR